MAHFPNPFSRDSALFRGNNPLLGPFGAQLTASEWGQNDLIVRTQTVGISGDVFRHLATLELVRESFDYEDRRVARLIHHLERVQLGRQRHEIDLQQGIERMQQRSFQHERGLQLNQIDHEEWMEGQAWRAREKMQRAEHQHEVEMQRGEERMRQARYQHEEEMQREAHTHQERMRQFDHPLERHMANLKSQHRRERERRLYQERCQKEEQEALQREEQRRQAHMQRRARLHYQPVELRLTLDVASADPAFSRSYPVFVVQPAGYVVIYPPVPESSAGEPGNSCSLM